MSNIQQQFRDAMAKLAASVNIVTTDGEAGKSGLTATAVCSVTDSPPTLLVCVNHESQSNEALKINRKLCVNVCNSEHQELSMHFAGMTELEMEDRFELDVWTEGKLGMPLLKGALASFEGHITAINEVSTHSVIFVEIEQILINDNQEGLVYFSRNFTPVKG